MPKSVVEAALLVVSSELRKTAKVDDLLRDANLLQKYGEVLKWLDISLKINPENIGHL